MNVYSGSSSSNITTHDHFISQYYNNNINQSIHPSITTHHFNHDDDHTNISTNIMDKNKKIKIKNMKKIKVASTANCFEEQQQRQLKSDIQFQTHKVVTERRSQKLSDKITALQKLVSPYGKTDTASVLEEAFISITELQIHIKNMSLMFMSNNHLDSQKSEDQMELQRMGLCLVPLTAIHSKFEGKSKLIPNSLNYHY
ncbi:transcription factor bHLH113-like [Impatiens glandulifera]|uniref:transcription factor bHLH113-like n=1 Tax=Impatiens glandulifera TaxID=253017 RepID=UPI001FB09E6D|nr:transcription factor bHLH113-like [Impatiens glandulifera]